MFKEVKKYDELGNLIYHKGKGIFGKKEWWKHDENNNEIYYKTSTGIEKNCDYDENNNLIHYVSSEGYEEWSEYDENNNKTYYKSTREDEYIQEEWFVLNSDGEMRLTHLIKHSTVKYSENIVEQKFYDNWGNISHYQRFKGSIPVSEYWEEYDENGDKLHFKNSDGLEMWFKKCECGNDMRISKEEFDEIHKEKGIKKNDNTGEISRLDLLDLDHS